MQPFITRIKTNLNGVLQMTQMIDGIMMTGDDIANQIIVELHRDRVPVIIPEGTRIVGYFIRPDGYTLEIDGSAIAENQAMVEIPALAYQIPGALSIAIRMFIGPHQEQQRGYYDSETTEFVIVDDPSVTEGPHGEPVMTRTHTAYDNKIVIAAASCFVQITETDSVIEPGHSIPDINDVIQKLADIDMEEAAWQEAEAIRVANENGRISAESSRVTAETARANAESARATAETARASAETARQNAESARADAESTRVSNENTRKSNETSRQNAESARVTAESSRVSAESVRANAESGRVSAESTRVSNENTRKSNETSRVNAESARATAETNRATAETSRANAESTRVSNENTRKTNETARQNAESARVTAENSRVTAEAARENAIQNMSVASETLAPYSDPTVTITNVDGHKHIKFGLVPGNPFVIKKSFASVAEMQAYTGTDVKVYDFVIITSNVQDPDNAKLYMKRTSDWYYVTDLSGSQGIQGPQGIQGETGNGIATAVVGSDYKLKLTFTDGTTYTSGSIRGAKGETGATGNGISNASVDANYKLNLSFTDGTSYQSGSIRGATGATGNGISNASVDANYKLNLSFTDGTSYQSGSIRGATGATGATGPGIDHVVVNNDYTMTIYLENGTNYTTPFSMRGPEGPAGGEPTYDASTKTLVFS